MPGGQRRSAAPASPAEVVQACGRWQDRWIPWILWTAFATGICALVALGPVRTVTPVYFQAAADWMAGLPLYNDCGIGFLYLPQAALVFVPLAMLPTLAADIVWRLFAIGIYAWGVRRLATLAEKDASRRLFGLTTLIAIPLAASSARNGQATLPMAGFMMAAVAYTARESWWRAAVCLTLAISIKPLALVLVLLSAAVYKPLAWRLLVVLAIAALIPFLTQNPAYVFGQYMGFVRTTGLANDRSNVEFFAQVFGMLRVAGLEVHPHAQTWLRALFGALTLLVCLVYSRRMDGERWSVYFYTIAACYVMLFNPRTENNTYSLLGPAIAIFFAQAIRQRHGLGAVQFGLIALATFGTFEVGRLLTPAAQSIWLAPLMCIVFTAYVVGELLRPEAPAAEQLAKRAACSTRASQASPTAT